MLSDKGTNIFSEIGKFFKENDATSAMNAIIDMTKALRLSEKRLFSSESRCNCKLTQLQVLGLLMLFLPITMVSPRYAVCLTAGRTCSIGLSPMSRMTGAKSLPLSRSSFGTRLSIVADERNAMVFVDKNLKST